MPCEVSSTRLGVYKSAIRAARTGVRDGNDIVWVGRAANYATKMTFFRRDAHCTWISKSVYDGASQACRVVGPENESMWTQYNWEQGNLQVYGSRWWRTYRKVCPSGEDASRALRW